MKVLSILFITKSCHTLQQSRLKDLLNELDEYLTEIEANKPRTAQAPQEDVNEITNKRLPPLPWNKRLSYSFDSKRPLPPLPWHKRWDENGLDKNILSLISELEYRSKSKRLPPLPLDKRLPPLTDNKRLLPVPENRKTSDEEFEPGKRLPPLPWNKRGDAAIHDRKEYLMKVEELLELVKQLKERLFQSELDKRLSALPTNNRRVYSISDLEQVLQSYRDKK